MFLANTTTGLDGSFVLSALLLAVLVGQGLQIWLGIMRGKAQERRSISFEGTPVDKAEFLAALAANEAQHKDLFSKIGGVERGVRAEVKADTLRVEEKVNIVDRKVSGLEASNNAQNQKLAHMDGKLDRLVERPIR